MPRLLKKHLLIIILGALCVALALINPSFLTQDNLTNLARRISAVSVVAAGQTLVILTGGIDLSVGSVAALSGVIAGHAIKFWNWPVPLGMALGVGSGLGCGVVIGVLVTKGRIPAFIVTLGMMLAARGAAQLITGGSRIAGLPESFRWLGGGFTWWIPFVVMLALVGATAIMLAYMNMGREMYATGGNLVGARLSGINVDRVRIAAYALCGLSAGFAGVMLSSRTGVCDPTAAEGMELDSIAACVVGGASLMGGEGGAIGSLIGALIIGVLVNVCQLQGMPSEYQRIVLGALIITLVFFDNMRKRGPGALKE
ncbi:MAG: hypothetical protein AMXMBFR4_07830 [Candidatus Hydrogenedentota bacterium]